METNPSFTPKPSFYQRYAAIIKMATLGILVLLLLIPQVMIQDVIMERKRNQEEVKQEISSKWGHGQTVSGPIVSIPYLAYIKNSYGQTEEITRQIHLLPENLSIEGNLDTSLLKRSIYKVIAYKTDLKITGNFISNEINDLGISPNKIMWNKANISIGINDLTGIQDRITMNWGSQSFDFNPGLENKDNFRSGVSAPVRINRNDSIDFDLTLSIKGSDFIRFIPVGKVTDINLTSSCPNPSFDGNFLPVDRKVDKNGFMSKWKVLHLNRNFPQAWTDGNQDIDQAWFGVTLKLDIDPYLKTMRSAKYAILFIAMTFLSFFFIEILNKKKIHPIQYILIGLVLVVFYTLLLSLSEQESIGFDWAYLISSLAVIVLITVYTASVLQSRQKTGIIFTVLAVLYAFIYIIIQMAEQSLLFGSIGLFLFLAAVMIISRKIDWYNIGIKDK
jgi:inner membrane protein